MQQASTPLEELNELLDQRDDDALKIALSDVHPADIADALEGLTLQNRIDVWQQTPEDKRGDILAELSDGVFKSLADDIDKKQLIDAIKQLEVDDIADLIPHLPDTILADVLFAVDSETRATLDEVLAYPEDSAGGLMDLDATVVRDNISLLVALRFLRLKTRLPGHTDAIYLVDRNNMLTGILPLSRLITAPLEDSTKQHAVNSPVFFNCLDSEEDVAKAFADYDLISAPVIDEQGKLVGRITIDDVVDVIREHAEHDVMAPAGLKNEQDIFAPVTKTSRSRALWLGVNLITALLGSWVIGQFEGSIQQLVALAVLMPIIASMGGNAGTQTLTVVIRGMGNGTITSSNVLSVLKKEFLVGILNGLLWAMVIALIATLWYQNLQLGLVIAIAMVANLVMGAVAGVCLPVVFEKLDIDPALAGGVALTTVTDVVGYFSVLGLATWVLL